MLPRNKPQNAVSAYFTSKHILHLWFADRYDWVIVLHIRPEWRIWHRCHSYHFMMCLLCINHHIRQITRCTRHGMYTWDTCTRFDCQSTRARTCTGSGLTDIRVNIIHTQITALYRGVNSVHKNTCRGWTVHTKNFFLLRSEKYTYK